MIQAKHGRFWRGSNSLGGFMVFRLVGPIEFETIPVPDRPAYTVANCPCWWSIPGGETNVGNPETVVFSYTRRNQRAIDVLFGREWCQFYFKQVEYRGFTWYGVYSREMR